MQAKLSKNNRFFRRLSLSNNDDQNIHLTLNKSPDRSTYRFSSSKYTNIFLPLLAFCGMLFLMACNDQEDKTASNDSPVLLKISTAPGDFYDLANEYLAPELTKAGYPTEVLVITDVVVPNIALTWKSLMPIKKPILYP